jgi:hypothetical protein
VGDLVIRWPDGEEEPLTPELGEALTSIVRVFGNGCRYVRRRRVQEPAPIRLPGWLRDAQRSTTREQP